MKLSLFLIAVFAAYFASAVPVKDDLNLLGDKVYPRYVDMAGGDGQLHRVDLEAEPDYEALDDIMRNPNNNEYLLFTRRNRRFSQTLNMGTANSIRNSNFNPIVPTIVIVHGWLSSRYTEPNPSVRAAYLDKSDVNVIVMCWRRRAALDYGTAARGVPAIGRGLGQFLNFLHQTTGAPFNRMHLIGFRLGAHVVGNAGRELRGQVARVTGLDPAGPLWNLNRDRLGPNDGVYVEAIHTDGGLTIGGLGIGTAIAQVDFFRNGGVTQPGCLTNMCNHDRAWELFASTVTNNHLVGRQCSNTVQISANTCRGGTLHMGNDDLGKTGVSAFVSTAKIIMQTVSVVAYLYNLFHCD